ncbi:MAG: zinc ribbon domain-containing protein [Candidatus Rifleibacteriota bacterium]
MIPVKKLIPLQELDLKIDEANISIKNKKQKVLKMEKEIKADEDLCQKKKALLKKITLRKRAAESELDSINEKIKESDLRLKGAGLKPATYSALEKEIATLKGKAEKLETAVLEDMEKIDMLQKDTAKGDKVIAGRKIHLEEISNRINDDILGIKKDIENLRTQRSQMSLKVESDLLEKYEDLRHNKKGQVIFDTDNPSCPACGMGLPGGFVNAVSAHDEAEKCSNCGVLLHWTGQREQ